MDFYIVLGVKRAASLGDIKRAYRRLARRFHPDINPGDQRAAAHFREISEAYETLVDPERRRRYDAGGGRAQAPSEEATFGFEGFDFSAGVVGVAASTFGDLFADVLRQRGEPADIGQRRGTDLHHAITISFEDSVRGGQRRVAVTRQEHCRTCNGLGRLQVAESRCGHCQGTGALKSSRGHMVFSKACAHCGGTGRLNRARCPSCGGSQVRMQAESLTVAVPPGLADGARVRIAGKGNAGPNGGESGDLFITVHVEPHDLFWREGDDLRVVVPIAVHEAALGTRFELAALDGPVRVRVPPGTQSGQRFRLRERGVASPRDGRRGDLVVEVRVVLPKLLDERSKELLKEFGKINSEDVRAGLRGRGRQHEPVG
jgi:molecular chaperone DnaJ